MNDCERSGDPIRLVAHTTYSTATFRGARLLYLPFTYAAFGIAAYEQWKKRIQEGDPKLGANEYTLAEYMALVPLQFSIDWWKSAYWFGRSLIGGGEADPFGGQNTYMPTAKSRTGDGDDPSAKNGDGGIDHAEHVIGLPEALFLSAREVFEYVSGRESDRNGEDEGKAARPRDRVDDVVDLATNVIETGFNIGERIFESLAARRSDGHASPRRRWRAKH